ncbi:MAG: hypothetical protein BRD35_01730 [Bacteroidetes bacterium QH_7_62_13]|nr:MAG: hypothetical protein BRD35_01730 [Bacteroidetes bacterium QH_7_62_13]
MAALSDGTYMLSNIQWHHRDEDGALRPLRGFTTGTLTVEGGTLRVKARFTDQNLSNRFSNFEEDGTRITLQVSLLGESDVYRIPGRAPTLEPGPVTLCASRARPRISPPSTLLLDCGMEMMRPVQGGVMFPAESMVGIGDSFEEKEVSAGAVAVTVGDEARDTPAADALVESSVANLLLIPLTPWTVAERSPSPLKRTSTPSKPSASPASGSRFRIDERADRFLLAGRRKRAIQKS